MLTTRFATTMTAAILALWTGLRSSAYGRKELRPAIPSLSMALARRSRRRSIKNGSMNTAYRTGMSRSPMTPSAAVKGSRDFWPGR